jgi:hypothetical protein
MDAAGSRLAKLDRGFERGQRQADVDRAADRIADCPTRPGVENDRDVSEALDDSDIGVSRPKGFRLRPLAGRVGDWRASLDRSLCSLLSRSFGCECHTISAMPRFQPPPSNAACGFPALRSPVCFAPRVMGPTLPERLSALVEPLGSR